MILTKAPVKLNVKIQTPQASCKTNYFKGKGFPDLVEFPIHFHNAANSTPFVQSINEVMIL
jgi:hypothetical protein